jgi:hypothetical protein
VQVVGIVEKEKEEKEWTFNLNTEAQEALFDVERKSLDENRDFA